MSHDPLHPYTMSLVAVLRRWTPHTLPLDDLMDLLRSVGLTEEQAAAVVADGIERGLLCEERREVWVSGAPQPPSTSAMAPSTAP